jgi:hypothetical protein
LQTCFEKCRQKDKIEDIQIQILKRMDKIQVDINKPEKEICIIKAIKNRF